jgi:FMN phosphatase YigB (HAD superfamily)
VNRTLLLDLDGTLLINEMGAFLVGYMRALGKHMAHHIEPEQLVSSLLASTHVMAGNENPEQTLKDTFDSDFYPKLQVPEAQVRETINAFYTELFPTLKELTQPNPDTAGMLEEAIRRGWRIGIATNPLFPRTAIHQRLDWAGIDPTSPKIELISSYENFHFAKPKLTYYAEFLALMGWPEGPVIMVGNDPEADIIPARKLGLPAYYTPEPDSPFPPLNPDIAPSGRLSDLFDWIDSQPAADLQPDYSSPEALLAILKATPAALKTMAQELSPEAWTYCPLPGEWCMAEVTCHLRDVDAEVNLPRMHKMLDENNPFIPGMDTDRWVSERQYIVQDCMEALSDFVANRVELLNLLEGLHPESWQLPARHAILGPTHLHELVSIIASHDRLHIQQIFNSLPGKQSSASNSHS